MSKGQWRSIGTALDLSSRQLEVVRCLFDGLDEELISRELRISPHTVHTYLDRLHKKLRVKSRSEVIVRVFLAYLSRHSEDRRVKFRPPAPAVRSE